MTSPLSPEAVEAGELLAGLTPLEMDQYAGLTPLERVAAATHPHISMCRLGDTRMDCITCADELHRIRAYLAAVQPVIEERAVADERRNVGLIEEIASAIESYEPEAHPVICPPSIAYAAAKERAVLIVQGFARAPRHAAPDDGIGDDSAPVAAAPEGEVSGA